MTDRPAGGPAAAPGVAAFDFDGTLTRTDSFVAFLRRVGGNAGLAAAWARVPLGVAAARSGGPFRDKVKATLVAEVLGGRPLSEVAAAGRAYGSALAETVTPAMRAVLEDHRRRGHRLVVVSASLEIYLETAAERLGLDAVLATRLEVDPAGRLTGELAGANCRGAEKARRLAEWMALEGLAPATPVWAYGDSAGDSRLLAGATYATRVRRGRPPGSGARPGGPQDRPGGPQVGPVPPESDLTL